MATTTNLSTLKINYLTQAQFDAAVANNTVKADELYLTPAGNNITINLNGSDVNSPSFYAPITSGTANHILVSGGANTAPTWKATANGAAYATSANGALTFGTLPIAQGGTGATTAANALKNLLGTTAIGSTTKPIYWTGSAFSAISGSAGSAYVPVYLNAGAITACSNPSMLTNLGSTTAASIFAASPRPGVTGTLLVANGGTGMTTTTNVNAVVIGNSSSATSAMQTVATTNGAFYATAANAKPVFGTLPVAQGGTGATTATNALQNLVGTTAIGTSTKPIYWTGSAFNAISSLPSNLVSWGTTGASFTAALDPIGTSLNYRMRGNRFAGVAAAAITVEYSQNAGSTWTDYGLTDIQKRTIFTGAGSSSAIIGKRTTAGSTTASDMLRVTLTATSIYTIINVIEIYISTNGSSGCQVQIEGIKNGATTWEVLTAYKDISGWSGWNEIYTNFCMSSSSSHTSYYNQIRFTFKTTSTSTSYTGLNLQNIFGFGGQGWTSPSNLAAYDHLYTWDGNLNATFPADVTISGLLNITKNSNTTTIGSQNANFCHIYNSANIPFIFNNSVLTTSGNLGNTTYRFGQLYLGRVTADSRALNSANPLIEFSNSDRSQYAQLIYTDYNNQGGSDSFTFASNQTDLRVYAPKVYGAVWNDYAEFRETKNNIEPGRCIKETGKGDLVLTQHRLERGCEVVSDTFGFAIGENEKCKTPTAASGRVLVYLYEDNDYAKNFIGWPVCSGPNGTVSIMTEKEEREYPSRIIGTISEIPDYEEWKCGIEDNPQTLKVDGRIWIRIK